MNSSVNACSHSIHRVAVDEVAVRDKSNHTTLSNAVAGPPDCTDIAVVEIRSFGADESLGVGLADALVQQRVCEVLVVVVLASLPRRIRRVGNHHADRAGLLSFHAGGVFGEGAGDLAIDRIRRVGTCR